MFAFILLKKIEKNHTSMLTCSWVARTYKARPLNSTVSRLQPTIHRPMHPYIVPCIVPLCMSHTFQQHLTRRRRRRGRQRIHRPLRRSWQRRCRRGRTCTPPRTAHSSAQRSRRAPPLRQPRAMARSLNSRCMRALWREGGQDCSASFKHNYTRIHDGSRNCLRKQFSALKIQCPHPVNI